MLSTRKRSSCRLQIGAVRRHGHPLPAQRLAQLIVVDVVLLLDLLDRGVDLLAGDRSASARPPAAGSARRRSAAPAPRGAAPSRAPRACPGRACWLTSASSGADPLLDLAGQDDAVADDRGDPLDDARLRGAPPASGQSPARPRRERACEVKLRLTAWLGAAAGRAGGWHRHARGGGAPARRHAAGTRRGASRPGIPPAPRPADAARRARLDHRPWPGSSLVDARCCVFFLQVVDEGVHRLRCAGRGTAAAGSGA